MSDALDSIMNDIARASFIQQKVKEKFVEKIRQVALDAHRRGVQRGYEKLLQDFRDGHINLSLSSRHDIDIAIAKAQANEFAPSEYFK